MAPAAPAETILIIEDDEALARGLAHNLRHDGYQVLHARDGDEGLRLACEQEPDLIILDLMLPGMSGLDVLGALRDAALEMQIIILSARGLEEDKVAGLRLGADDYVAKPFGLSELLARIEAALRRPRLAQQRPADQTLHFGDVALDVANQRVSRNGQPIHLTARELRLLIQLAAHPGRLYSREQLLQRVWGYDYAGTARTVDNFVRNLRQKLEADPARPRYITTVHGEGYRFDP